MKLADFFGRSSLAKSFLDLDDPIPGGLGNADHGLLAAFMHGGRYDGAPACHILKELQWRDGVRQVVDDKGDRRNIECREGGG